MMYQITTPNACFGIIVEEGVITEAAPIAGKVVGLAWDAVKGRYGAGVGAVKEQRSVWVRDKSTGAVVGYLTPDRVLVRIANAGDIYARYLRVLRQAMEADRAAGEAARDGG